MSEKFLLANVSGGICPVCATGTLSKRKNVIGCSICGVAWNPQGKYLGNPYKRKTTDEWNIQGRYGSRYGWEDVSAYDNWREAREDLKAYRENEPEYPHRLTKRRIKINPKTSGTPVMFRKWSKAEGGSIIALFPTILGTNDPYTCSSYEHIGQHGSAEPVGLIQRTTKATPAEYKDLMKELHSIGYRNLVVYDRYQHDWLENRRKQLAKYRNPVSTQISALRKEIKSNYPHLKFRIRTISFSDLARSSKIFVDSDEWGMAKGNQAVYKAVAEIAKKHGAIASW